MCFMEALNVPACFPEMGPNPEAPDSDISSECIGVLRTGLGEGAVVPAE